MLVQNGKSISTASSASKIDNKEVRAMRTVAYVKVQKPECSMSTGSNQTYSMEKFMRCSLQKRPIPSSHYMDPPMSSSSGGPTYEEMAKK
ncbi:hypothetical protein L915_16191 [Phytophthora nicotianae]|uniref:Uncharacterized protein n=1 Tax=Phytophthora nicotianae TaxID=4792 RepID=W2G3D3_PHYNI|nr:hypothetical protein L915_16191 [Phytophthora nicotianae]